MTIELGGTRWTSNTPHPFSRAPGAGGRSLRGLHESGFAAESAPVQRYDYEAENLKGRLGWVVRKEPIGAGDVPSAVVRMRFTDRGLLTQARLDKDIHAFLKANGFLVSRATSFKPVQVTWKWEQQVSPITGDVTVYRPVVATPVQLAGVGYSGSALTLPPTSADPEILAKLPKEIWVYTMAATQPLLGRVPGGPSVIGSMTDAEAARVMTLLKQAMVNIASAQSYANVLLTVRGCPPNVFEDDKPVPTPVVLGFSSLLLLVAYNMVASHIGSERL